MRKPKTQPRKRKTLFSGLRRAWSRHPATQVISSGKEYNRRRQKELAREVKSEAKGARGKENLE